MTVERGPPGVGTKKMVLAIALLLSGAGNHAAVLYDNGPINGHDFGAYTIDSVETSNSFVLSSDSVLTGVSFGSWVFPDGRLLTVDWAIGVDFFDRSHGSGTSSPTSAFVKKAGGYFDVYSSSFELPQIRLRAGTYYLTLFNATDVPDANVYWDVNGGPSAARISNQEASNGSNSFQIFGVVPEPEVTWLLVVGFAALSRRRFARP